MIRDRRLERGLSMGQVAQRAGISRGFLNNIEKGRIVPRAEVLGRLADALEIPRDSIFELAVEDRVRRLRERDRKERAAQPPSPARRRAAGGRGLSPDERAFLRWFKGLPPDERSRFLAQFGPGAAWVEVQFDRIPPAGQDAEQPRQPGT